MLANSVSSELPRITIITPSFNQGQYIEETIQSVLSQGYPNLEYIVMDGGSTDNTLDILHKYAHHFTYWESEKDRGQSHALNKGFSRATGDIWGWLCSDDVLTPGTLLKVGKAMVGKSRTMFIGAAMIINGEDTTGGKLDLRRPTYNQMLYVGRTYPQPSVFWTRDLAQLTGEIDESMYYCMDYDYFLRMRRHSPSIIYTDDVLSYERDHPHSKGSSQTTLGEIYKNRERHRVYAALKAVRERGESPKMWLRKVLLWRSVSMLSRGRRPRRNFYHGVARKMVNRNIYDLQTDL